MFFPLSTLNENFSGRAFFRKTRSFLTNWSWRARDEVDMVVFSPERIAGMR